MRYTLVGDGASDEALVHVIDWALKRQGLPAFDRQWAKPEALPPVRDKLAARLLAAVELYPCDLLFVHRDGEGEDRQARVLEIQGAMSGIAVPHVAVVPIRMLEAWLLHDERVIRRASGNGAGREDLLLPRLKDLELEADPKERLRQALLTASGLGPHRRQKRAKELSKQIRLVGAWIEDYSPLLALPAFSAFIVDLKDVLASLPRG